MKGSVITMKLKTYHCVVAKMLGKTFEYIVVDRGACSSMLEAMEEWARGVFVKFGGHGTPEIKWVNQFSYRKKERDCHA